MAVATYEEIGTKVARCHERHGNIFPVALSILKEIGLYDDSGGRVLREDSGDARRESKEFPGYTNQVPALAEKPRRRPTDFPFDLLAECMIGRDWKEHLGISRSDNVVRRFEDMSRRYAGVSLFKEEGAAPIGPSVWANVAAWSATVGGLMQAQFIQGYQQAAFDVADLFPFRPPVFWQGGERYIDIIGPYKPASEVAPGEEYPDHNMSALWVEPGPMKKYAGKILVAKETAAIDISGGQLLAKAKEGGQSLKFRENELALDVITGQTNNWKLGMLTDASATAYNTYGPTITNPQGTSRTIPNDIVNPFNDPGAMQVSDEQLANLYHPVTDNPIDVDMSVALFPTPMAKWANALNSADAFDQLVQTAAGTAAAAPGDFPNAMARMQNPWKGLVRGIASRWLHQRHVASTTQTDTNRTAGLGLSGTAVYRWYRLDPQAFAARRQMWPATSIDISPGDYILATHGIIAAQAFDIATMVQILNPYAIQRNKGS